MPLHLRHPRCRIHCLFSHSLDVRNRQSRPHAWTRTIYRKHATPPQSRLCPRCWLRCTPLSEVSIIRRCRRPYRRLPRRWCSNCAWLSVTSNQHLDPVLLFNLSQNEKERKPMLDQDFPKADPVPRGCGDREPGGVYAECGLSPRGRPLEEFLIDPPLPIPAGLDLINKPQTWQRMLPSGEPALDVEGLPIYDLLIWVGAEHYPYCPDYLEETRRHGAARRLNPNPRLPLLSPTSRMILAHPLVLNTAWQTQRPPESCKKEVPGHETAIVANDDEGEDLEGENGEEIIVSPFLHRIGTGSVLLLSVAQPESPRTGPFLFKLWELIPREAAHTVIDIADGEAGKQQTARNTLHHYFPSNTTLIFPTISPNSIPNH